MRCTGGADEQGQFWAQRRRESGQRGKRGRRRRWARWRAQRVRGRRSTACVGVQRGVCAATARRAAGRWWRVATGGCGGGESWRWGGARRRRRWARWRARRVRGRRSTACVGGRRSVRVPAAGTVRPQHWAHPADARIYVHARGMGGSGARCALHTTFLPERVGERASECEQRHRPTTNHQPPTTRPATNHQPPTTRPTTQPPNHVTCPHHRSPASPTAPP